MTTILSLSFLSLLITGISTWFIYKTLKEGNKALKETKENN